MFNTLSFSVHPRYFKYKSCRKSDGYERIHAPNDSMHDILIFGSMSLYRCTNNLQKKLNGQVKSTATTNSILVIIFSFK